jgi:hypothetical protein
MGGANQSFEGAIVGQFTEANPVIGRLMNPRLLRAVIAGCSRNGSGQHMCQVAPPKFCSPLFFLVVRSTGVLLC